LEVLSDKIICHRTETFWHFQKWDLLNLTPKKYDICILIVVVNSADTGKISVISYLLYS
jgi:hypothetical protein